MKKILFAALFALVSFTASAEKVAPYSFSNPILREAPSKIAAAYVTINNTTDKSDELISAKADWADHIQLHKVTANDSGVMQMTEIKEINLPAHGKAELKQGGYHLMIFGVKEKLAVDDKKDITLHFKNAGDMIVTFAVQPLGNAAMQAQKEMPMHDHMMNMPGM